MQPNRIIQNSALALLFVGMSCVCASASDVNRAEKRSFIKAALHRILPPKSEFREFTAPNSKQAGTRVNERLLKNLGSRETHIIVDVSKQRAYLVAHGKIVIDTPVSTARSGKYTPRGTFNITQRVRSGKRSSIYGCAMPNWMRLDQSPYGLHVGQLPGHPASAGCVRLPVDAAKLIFNHTSRGTTVRILNSWQMPVSRVVAG